MIFATAEGDAAGTVLLVALTFEELRTLIQGPGHTVNGYGAHVSPDGKGLRLVLFGAGETDDECRAYLRSLLPQMPDPNPATKDVL